MPLIAAENLQKDYQAGDVTVKALKEISFEIEPSSFVSFVGPSGSGKTTFIFSTHDQKIVGEAEIIFTLEDGELKGRQAKGGGGNG